MRQYTTIRDLRERLLDERRAGHTIALIPTMGALHQGHLSLVDDAKLAADTVVMSIFVNPLQFGEDEDLDNYPRTLERDAELAAGRGVDILFVPETSEIYGSHDSGIRVAPGESAGLWEGAVRKGHFDGVLTVVAKLFNIVEPDVASFGQKDIQQATLITGMVGDLNFPIDIRIVPIARDADGLALSSRNSYLSDNERTVAVGLPHALKAVAAAWRSGVTGSTVLQQAAMDVLAGAGIDSVDYIAIAEPGSLKPISIAIPGTVVAIAVRIGSTRLLDNLILGEEDV